MATRVAFFGLGIMGQGMAANLLKAGFPLVVYNRSAEKGEPLKKEGAKLADSPRAAAEQADIAVACVTGPEAVEALLFGEDGAAEALKGKSFVNMSTVSPQYTEELDRKLRARKITLIDAPVSGSKKPAEEGTLVILAGGPKEAVDQADPLFQAMGKKVVYCGDCGKGTVMKMSINLLLGVMMEGFAEMVNFGVKGGLDKETLLQAVTAGPLGCGLFQLKEPMLRDEQYPTQFPLKHMTKDLKFAIDTAHESGAASPAAHMAYQLYREGINQSWGDEDFAAVARVLLAQSKE